ncbi:MAG TPA: hypothetical protein VGP12_00460 [Nitrosospira sp.]|nr:hypothetical protein [Nitrosospira sp.]
MLNHMAPAAGADVGLGAFPEVSAFQIGCPFLPNERTSRSGGIELAAFAFGARQACRQIVTLTANCSQSGRTRYALTLSYPGGGKLGYQIVATRENETVRYERNSVLIAIAKARVWISEGWDVVITDKEGRTLEPGEFDKLSAA